MTNATQLRFAKATPPPESTDNPSTDCIEDQAPRVDGNDAGEQQLRLDCRGSAVAQTSRTLSSITTSGGGHSKSLQPFALQTGRLPKSTQWQNCIAEIEF